VLKRKDFPKGISLTGTGGGGMGEEGRGVGTSFGMRASFVRGGGHFYMCCGTERVRGGFRDTKNHE